MSVAVVLYPGATLAEVMPAISLLGRAPVYVGPTLEPIALTEGLVVLPAQTYASAADAATFRLVLLPGGDPEAVIEDQNLHRLLAGTFAAGGTLAAICNGALLLGTAGLTHGRQITHTAVRAYAPEPAFDALVRFATEVFVGATYIDEDVVVDDRIITAKPWALLDFARIALTNAGVLESEVAASKVRYLRGLPDLRPVGRQP